MSKPDPFIDMENAIRSSWATTLPVWSESKTLKILFITTSASHLNNGTNDNRETERIMMFDWFVLRKYSLHHILQLRSTNLTLGEIYPKAVPESHDLQVCELIVLDKDDSSVVQMSERTHPTHHLLYVCGLFCIF